MRKGHWSVNEDAIIVEQMKRNASWTEIVKALGGKRTTKQCRERWSNHLDPSLKKTKWTVEEDEYLVEAQARLGNSWTRIAMEMPGRSENEVKNRWYSAVHKMISGRKRKVIKDDYSGNNAEYIQDSECEEAASQHSRMEYTTNYMLLEQEVYRLIQDVQLFLRGDHLELGGDTDIFAQIGMEFLQQHHLQSGSCRLETRDSNTTKESHPSNSIFHLRGVEGLISRTSTELDMGALRDASVSVDYYRYGTSPDGSLFMANYSINPSPSWFGITPQSSSTKEES